jgi:hypothetical protein
MSIYSAEDEHRIRTQALVREWTKSGLLDPSQGAVIETELRVDLRRTNVFLRAGLALFTVFIVAASVMLTVEIFDLDRPIQVSVTTAISAAVCLGLAHYLVVRQRFYRFGVEEALAASAVALIAFSVFSFTNAQDTWRHGNVPPVAGLLAAAASACAVYWRFGYVYAAIGAIAFLVAVPFRLEISSALQHTLAAAALTAVFGVARTQRARHEGDYPGDDYALIEAATWAGLYLTLNLQLTFARIGGPLYGSAYPRVGGLFYGFTYTMIWALPVAGLYLAIRDKHRPLLDVSLVMALLTLLTNKSYLGWPRHAWDPILLGVFLMAAAIAVRRWLTSGPNGQRAGFTPARILSTDRGAVTILGTASARFHPDAPSYPESDKSGFDGGRSGGGGATGSY